MAKACPPGVFCIENISIMYFIIIFALVGFYIYYTKLNQKTTNNQMNPIIIKERVVDNGFFPKFNNSYNNHPENVLLNPFVAPLKNNGYFPPDMGDPRGIPINVKTRGFDTNYRQVGILTRIDGKEAILPLWEDRYTQIVINGNITQ